MINENNLNENNKENERPLNFGNHNQHEFEWKKQWPGNYGNNYPGMFGPNFGPNYPGMYMPNYPGCYGNNCSGFYGGNINIPLLLLALKGISNRDAVKYINETENINT